MNTFMNVFSQIIYVFASKEKGSNKNLKISMQKISERFFEKDFRYKINQFIFS